MYMSLCRKVSSRELFEKLADFVFQNNCTTLLPPVEHEGPVSLPLYRPPDGDSGFDQPSYFTVILICISLVTNGSGIFPGTC